MSVYESIIQGLNEAVDYQQGKLPNRAEGASRRLLELVRDNPDLLRQFQAQA
ncbi:hypothetical protein FACS1894130_08470 [Spirochaetia bacterium]|nr:hypothetical protein FACS1894130_08470 [Spirochaetia bacterium]